MRILAVILAAVLLLTACDEPASQGETTADTIRPVKITTARSIQSIAIKTFPGVTEATRKSVLAFRVGGQITELPVRAGQGIKKGDLIARLDEAGYRNALANSRAKYDLAKTQYERAKTLFAQKHIAQSRLDEARANFEAAEAGLKLRQDDLAYTRLTAPYDGLIARVEVDNFQNVQPQQPIVQYQDAKNIDVLFSIPENLFLKLNRENTGDGHVLIRFDSDPDRAFDAWYREHESVPDVATRAYKVTVTMPLPKDRTVVPGMSVTVEADLSAIYGDEANKGVLIPIEALFEEDGQTWVWTLGDDMVARKTAVAATEVEGEFVRIVSGLDNGQQVIAAGTSYIREGQKVRAMVKERGL